MRVVVDRTDCIMYDFVIDQRLSGDLERLRIEKEALETEKPAEENTGAHADHEWASLQQRLKVGCYWCQ